MVRSQGSHPLIGDAFAWNIAPAPTGPNGRQSYTGDDRFTIWAGTPHPEAAWKFVQFLTSKEGQEINLSIEGLAPVRRLAFPAYAQLSDKYNLDVLITNMQDAGAPLNAMLPGDVTGRKSQFWSQDENAFPLNNTFHRTRF